MAEYVKKIELIKKLCDKCDPKCEIETTRCGLVDTVIQMATADVAEVKRGEWIWDINATDWGIGAWICSECHVINNNIPQRSTCRPLAWTGSKFCPNCGADMRGE